MSELHNQTPITTLPLTNRIASGVPSQTGCDNITVENFIIQVGEVRTKIVFASAGYTTYTPAQYEKVIGYTFVQGSSTDTIKITLNLWGDIIVDENDDYARDFNYFATSANATVRRIKIELSAAGTVYIHSIKNLIP